MRFSRPDVRHALSRRAFGAAAASVLLAGLLAGCGSGQSANHANGSGSGTTTEWTTAAFTARSIPNRVQIPAIKVDAPIETVGLADNGTVETPPLDQPKLTGWYENGPTPGQQGPAVILGHVDTAKTGPAVFYDLKKLKAGDQVTVTRKDGSVALFAIEKITHVAKNQFPSKQVYGDIGYAGLRLVTCGGTFDRAKRSYADNIIAFAKLVRTKNA